MNPIEAILQQLFGLIHRIPSGAQGGALMLFGGLLLMLYASTRKNMLGGQDIAEMKKWSLMSATMNDRIAALTPHYAASMALLAQRYVGALQGNKDMVGFIKSTKAETKEQAEMDYCLQDVDKEESVASLALKLETLLKK